MNDNALNPTLILNPIRQAAPSSVGTLEVLLRLQAPDLSRLTPPCLQGRSCVPGVRNRELRIAGISSPQAERRPGAQTLVAC